MMKYTKRFVLLLMLIIAALALTIVAADKRVYVSADGSGTGESWSNPANIEYAIKSSPSEIWLKAGVYNVTNLVIDKNITIRGGFAGTETDINQRQLTANVTTLKSDGSDRVLKISGDVAVTLDALAIKNGRAGLGSGIYNESGTLTVTHCSIADNNAVASSNDYFSGMGGGIYSMGPLKITNSTFSNNSAGACGGGVFSPECATLIINCTFKGNKVTGTNIGSDLYGGGGVYGPSLTTIVNSIFWGNIAGEYASFRTVAAYNCIAEVSSYETSTISSNMYFSDPKLSSSISGSGYYEITSNSPAKDAGLSKMPVVSGDLICDIPSDDQRGVARSHDKGVDIGSYEYYAGTTLSDVVSLDEGAQSKLAEAIAATSNVVNIKFAVSGVPAISTVKVPAKTSTTGILTFTVVNSKIATANFTAQAVSQTSVPINITPLQQKGILHTVSADNYEPKVDESSMLPVTATIEVSSADLQTVINKIQKRGGAKLDPAKVKKNPSIYATDLFYVLLLQKQLVDEGTKNKYVTLVPDILSAAEAENMGILTLAPKGDGIIVSLKYYVADAWIDNGATVQDGNLIVGDGCKNGRIVDPVWLNMVGTVPLITTTTLKSGVKGTAYSATLAADGTTPITWSMVSGSLPAGLKLSSSGLITGIPTAGGTSSFTVKAANDVGEVTKAYSIKINIAPQMTTTSLNNGEVGKTYTSQLTSLGTNPVVYELVNGRLPSGLTISKSGAILGIPRISGKYSFRIAALNDAGTAESSFSIIIAPINGQSSPLLTKTNLKGVANSISEALAVYTYDTDENKKMIANILGITSNDLDVTGEGVLSLKDDVFQRALSCVKGEDKSLSADRVFKLPITTVRADNAIGNIFTIAFKVSGDVFGNVKSVSDIKAMKVFTDGSGKLFTPISTPEKISDKTCALLDNDGSFVTRSIDKETSYTFVAFIKDGSSFDLDGMSNSAVTDPIAIIRVESYDVPGQSMDESEDKESSGTNNCNAGFGALALLAAIPVLFVRKKS
jgi:Synergist-CTERM protein sorting domain-containing protein